MNLQVWERELLRCGLLSKHTQILRGLREGFDQGVRNATVPGVRYFCPPNHSSALAAKDKILENFRVELDAGRMAGPFSKEEAFKRLGFLRTSPIGAVVNGNGSTRPINDLSFPRNKPGIRSVNAEVDKDDFGTTWDNFKRVAEFLTSYNGRVLLAIFDWAKAYRQVPTSPEQWRFLMILTFDDQVLLDTRITFGGVAGCGVFGQVADTWKAIMLATFPLLAAFRWVDDTMFVKAVDEPSPLTLRDISALSAEMGVVENVEKRNDFAAEQRYLGFIWNGDDKTVRLPQGKVDARVNEIRTFLKSKSHRFKEVQSLAGRLNHTSMVFPQMGCYCVDIHRFTAEWVHKSAMRDIPESVREDLLTWLDVLGSASPRRLIPKPNLVNVGWVGDASTSYGIGIIIGKRWSKFRLRRGWNLMSGGEKRGIAWAETVAARLGYLMLKSLRQVQGERFLMLTDNTVTENAIRNGKSRDRQVNLEWRKLQDLLIGDQACIEVRRVKSEDNAADRLSRGFDSSKHVSDMAVIEIPRDLLHLITQEC